MSPSTSLNKLHILKLYINCLTDDLNSKICYFHFQKNHNQTNKIQKLDNAQKIPIFFRTSKEAMKVTGQDVPWYKSNNFPIATSLTFHFRQSWKYLHYGMMKSFTKWLHQPGCTLCVVFFRLQHYLVLIYNSRT